MKDPLGSAVGNTFPFSVPYLFLTFFFNCFPIYFHILLSPVSTVYHSPVNSSPSIWGLQLPHRTLKRASAATSTRSHHQQTCGHRQLCWLAQMAKLKGLLPGIEPLSLRRWLNSFTSHTFQLYRLEGRRT